MRLCPPHSNATLVWTVSVAMKPAKEQQQSGQSLCKDAALATASSTCGCTRCGLRSTGATGRSPVALNGAREARSTQATPKRSEGEQLAGGASARVEQWQTLLFGLFPVSCAVVRLLSPSAVVAACPFRASAAVSAVAVAQACRLDVCSSFSVPLPYVRVACH
jgi:hypothetical protein